MTFGEKMKDLMGQGLHASKEFVSKAGAKAQDLGEKGVLKLEIVQLESQVQKAVARLGDEVYAAFTERRALAVDAEDAVIKGILAEIAEIKASIAKREEELNNSSK